MNFFLYRESQLTSNYHHIHYNNQPHYQFQHQLKPKYPAFSRYGQIVDIELSSVTKKPKSKKSKFSKRNTK
jgi:hypothetical protein